MSLLGSELPRIYTPPLRPLTEETSLGFECIEFSDAIGVDLFPWERWFLIHALELNPDGTLRFRTLILLVARQNGKTTLLKILALFWMYVLGRLLVIGTAQNLDVAEETWADTVALAEASDELSPNIEDVRRASGGKALVLRTGERYKVAASNRRGGRGLSGDLVELDELREHQTWESWAAVSSTIMAIASALIVAASNAGDLTSVVLRQLRFLCMSDPRTVGVTERELESYGRLPVDEDQPEDLSADSVGMFEWSAEPQCGVWDRAGWIAANPSLGYTITEGALATQAKIAAAGGEAEWVFRTENLCQWQPTAGQGPFPSGAWDAGRDPLAEDALAEDAPVALCVDVSGDRSYAYIGMATKRRDGNVHLQVLAQRAGTDWVIPWLTSPDRVSRPHWTGVCWQLNGAPVSSLTDALRATDLPLAEWSGGDLPRASGILYDLVRLPNSGDPEDVGKLRAYHLPQPVLDVAAMTATTRKLGDGWVIDRSKSPVDAAPLVSVIGAAWLLLRPDEQPKHDPQVHEWPDDLLDGG